MSRHFGWEHCGLWSARFRVGTELKESHYPLLGRESGSIPDSDFEVAEAHGLEKVAEQ